MWWQVFPHFCARLWKQTAVILSPQLTATIPTTHLHFCGISHPPPPPHESGYGRAAVFLGVMPLSLPLSIGLKMEHGPTPGQSEAFPGKFGNRTEVCKFIFFFLGAADNSLFLFLELGDREQEPEITNETDTAERLRWRLREDPSGVCLALIHPCGPLAFLSVASVWCARILKINFPFLRKLVTVKFL